MDNVKRRRIRFYHVVFLIFLMAGTGYILNKNSQNSIWHESSGKIFGTFYNVKYQLNHSLDSSILETLEMVDASLSMFNPHSVVSQVNSNLTSDVDSFFKEVFLLSTDVSNQTEGCFDVTVAPLVNLWGFGFDRFEEVREHHVDSLLEFVGYKKVNLYGSQIFKSHASTQLDFSAVAKGYGVDCVARTLEKEGVSNYLVNIGGEIVAKGKSSVGKPWVVGIEIPDEDSLSLGTHSARLQLNNAALATSGNYRRFYYKDGKRYAHTIDPHTGRPVEHNLLSATVVAPNCALADAYATAFMVMGLDRAKEILSRHNELSAYFIYSDPDGRFKVWYSESLRKLLM